MPFRTAESGLIQWVLATTSESLQVRATAQTLFGRRCMLEMNRLLGEQTEGILIMLFTIAVILIVLWALGLVSGTTVGGFVHVLLVLAVIMVVFQLIGGRRNPRNPNL